MKHILCVLSLVFSVLCCTLQADDEKRVLIIGNSYTFYNDLPNVLQALSKKTKCPLIVDSHTAGAMSLRGFLESPQHARARQLVETGNYDWLILQDQSQTPAYKPEETMDSVRRWAAIAKKHNTKVLLFLTWAHASNEGGKMRPLVDMQELTSTAYCKAGIENKVKVAPVGEAWARWYRKNPNKPLHLEDCSHPNPTGTYLAACVLHASISGKPVKGSGTLTLNKNAVLRVPKGTTKEVQSIANATVKSFTPQKYLDKLAEREETRPSAAEIKAKLHKDITIEEITELAGTPVYKTTSGDRKSHQFRIRDGVELVVYFNKEGIVETVTLSAPGTPVDIIDVTKL